MFDFTNKKFSPPKSIYSKESLNTLNLTLVNVLKCLLMAVLSQSVFEILLLLNSLYTSNLNQKSNESYKQKRSRSGECRTVYKAEYNEPMTDSVTSDARLTFKCV